jgi:hypothetical protein
MIVDNFYGRVRALGIERNCAPLVFFRGGTP